jgi:hypothetical protein
MAGLYRANCKISGPAKVTATPDVDFNGLQWSYAVGLIFPPGSHELTVPVQLPSNLTP